VGVCDGIIDIAKNGPETELAVSIASARDSLRQELMPGTANYHLKELKEALALFQQKQGRQITIEAVLLGGINTGAEDAESLLDFVQNLDVTINVIPWNPVKGLCFEGKKLLQPEPKEITNFISMLKAGGLTVSQRFRRGRGISGACGQLG
jgi:23S rRNA (adenine2503-C2)-methyltransferase